MTKGDKILDTEEAWDTKRLGADEKYVKVHKSNAAERAAIDEIVGLQAISIRLQRELIDDFKLMAKLNGMGYQTLMRQVLTLWVDAEKKSLAREYISETLKDRKAAEDKADDIKKAM